MCHILFVLPFVSLILFLFLPFEQAAILYVPILLICAICYWLIWKDTKRPAATGVEGMIGGLGTVIEQGCGRARVFYKGELWEGICGEELSVGESVEITAVERMRLRVRKRIKGEDRAMDRFEGCHARFFTWN